MIGHQVANCRHQTSSSQMAKESDIQAVDIIHNTENEINEKDDDNELKTLPGLEIAQLFLSCGLDSLKIEKMVEPPKQKKDLKVREDQNTS